MRVLIVDDEPNARKRLQIMPEELDVEVVPSPAVDMKADDPDGRSFYNGIRDDF